MQHERRDVALAQLEKLKDKEYRDSYVFEHIATGIPFQVRDLRKQRGWSQVTLAKKADKKQPFISDVENNDDASFTLHTLMEIASAFDIALLVQFVPYTKFLVETDDVSPSALEVDSYESELNDLRNPSMRLNESSVLTWHEVEKPFVQKANNGADGLVELLFNNDAQKFGLQRPMDRPATIAGSQV